MLLEYGALEPLKQYHALTWRIGKLLFFVTFSLTSNSKSVQGRVLQMLQSTQLDHKNTIGEVWLFEPGGQMTFKCKIVSCDFLNYDPIVYVKSYLEWFLTGVSFQLAGTAKLWSQRIKHLHAKLHTRKGWHISGSLHYNMYQGKGIHCCQLRLLCYSALSLQ